MALEEIEIAGITPEEIRADASGATIQQLAALAYQAFRQPPWQDDLEPPRLHFGLGADLMRRNALLWVARNRRTGCIVGYTLGYEVFCTSDDPRDVTLAGLSSGPMLDGLFEGGQRIFYGDTLCVDAAHQGQRIGYRLAAGLIAKLRQQGFSYRLGRTHISAHTMRGLY